MSTTETIVMSVGGSLIVPDAIDTTFLRTLSDLITADVATHHRRFIIIAGGGKTARRYQEAANEVTTLTPDDLDWLGIHSTHLNGHLLRTIFRDHAYHIMIKNPDEVLDVPDRYQIIIAAGYRPGCSTDLRAVQIAERVNAKKVINLSNTDYVYTDNPHSNPNALALTDVTWPEFRALLPTDWSPGLSTPFDPIAAKAAEAAQMDVVHINGLHLEYLRDYLDNKPFTGTRIHP